MLCKMCCEELQDGWSFCPFCGMKAGTKSGEEGNRRAITFGELYEKWKEQYWRRISPSTQYCYRAARKYFEALAGKAFHTIDLEDLQRCVDQCPRGKRTKENMKSMASLMYRYALPRHMADQNYALFIDSGVGTPRPTATFSQEEVQRVLTQSGKTEYADEVAILIYTGFRPCEMLELRKENFVREGATCYLIGGRKTRAGRQRIVTLSEKIIPLIESRMTLDSDFLFPDDRGRKMSVQRFRQAHFYPALSEMGIQALPEAENPPRLKPYSCRHTFSDLIKNAEGADRDKAELMGHADYQTTRTMYQSSCIQACKNITDQL